MGRLVGLIFPLFFLFRPKRQHVHYQPPPIITAIFAKSVA